MSDEVEMPNSTNSSSNSTYLFYGWPLVFPMAVIIVVIMLFSVFGNLMVVVTIVRHRGMRTRTNMFLANLAIADVLAGVLDMPFSMITLIKGDWIFGDVMCEFNGFTNGLALHTSIFTLMLISIHKYISITRPFSRVMTPKRILVMIGAAWLWSSIYNLSPLFGWTQILYKKGATQCGPAIPITLTQKTHSFCNTIVNFTLPLSVMLFCNYNIFKAVRVHLKRMRSTSNIDQQNSIMQQKRITVTLVIVIVCYLLCWMPYIIYSCSIVFSKSKDAVPLILNPIAYWCGYLNSACNPIIYAFRSPSFRQGYLELLFGKRKGSVIPGGSFYTGSSFRHTTLIQRSSVQSQRNFDSTVNTQSMVKRIGSLFSNRTPATSINAFYNKKSTLHSSLHNHFNLCNNNECNKFLQRKTKSSGSLYSAANHTLSLQGQMDSSKPSTNLTMTKSAPFESEECTKLIVKKDVTLSLLELGSVTEHVDHDSSVERQLPNSNEGFVCDSSVENELSESPLPTPTVCVTNVDDQVVQSSVSHLDTDFQINSWCSLSASVESIQVEEKKQLESIDGQLSEPHPQVTEPVSRCENEETIACCNSPPVSAILPKYLQNYHAAREDLQETRSAVTPQTLAIPESNERSKSDPVLTGLSQAISSFGSVEHLDKTGSPESRKRARSKTVSYGSAKRSMARLRAKQDELRPSNELKVPDSRRGSFSVCSFFKKSKEHLSSSKNSVCETKDENS